MDDRGFGFGPFRPFRPFGAGDGESFEGRTDEIARLTKLLKEGTTTTLLHGEAGVGKTSLVRAGVLPALEACGITCVYVNARDLASIPPRPDLATGAILCIDDVGGAYDGAGGAARLERVLTLVAEAGSVRLLLIADDVDVWRVDQMPLGGPVPVEARQRLERLDQARAADIIEHAVLAGGSYLETGLSATIATDLARPGPILPATLQLVMGEVVARGLGSAAVYGRSGGPEAMLWGFFERACDLAGGPPARRVLAAVAAAPPHTLLSEEELVRATGLPGEQLRSCASAWSKLDMMQVVTQGAGVRVRLATEWIRPFAQQFTGEVRGRGVGARLALKRAIDGRRPLWPWELLEVWRFGGSLDQAERTFVRRTVQLLAGALAVLVLVPAAILITLSVRAGRVVHFAEDGSGPAARIVVRRGPPPKSPCRQAALVADAGFTRAALTALPPGRVRVGDPWADRVLAALRPLPRAALALIDGDPRAITEAMADPHLRAAAVDLLGAAGQGRPEEVALLRQAQGEATDAVRRGVARAAAALERRRPGSGVRLLAAALRDPDVSVRSLALAVVGELPDDTATTLLGAVVDEAADPSQWQPAWAALEARAARSPAAAQSIARGLRGPARGQAAGALAKLLAAKGPTADAAAATVAEVALDASAPPEARMAALRLLRARAVPGIERIVGPPSLMAAALPLIARVQPEAAAEKTAAALRGGVEQRAGAAAAFGVLPRTDETYKVLKAFVEDPAPEVRAEAVRASPVLGRRALALLATASKSGDVGVQRAVAETLAAHARTFGTASVAYLLGPMLKRAGRMTVIKALGTLAEHDHHHAISVLQTTLKHDDPKIRAAGVIALGEALGHGARQALPLLRRLARDDDSATRREAARALGRATPALAAAAARDLEPFAADREAEVRAAAAVSLGALGVGDRAMSQLVRDHDPKVVAAALEAARRLGKASGDLDGALAASFAAATSATTRVELTLAACTTGARPTVEAAAADRDATVRRAAVGCMLQLNPPAPAIATAALDDDDEGVRTAARHALVELKLMEPLARAARGPEPRARAAALEALAQFGSPAVPTLEAAIRDGSETVRAAAARSLGACGAAGVPALWRAARDPATDVRLAAVEGLGRALAGTPTAGLAARLADETDAEWRFAAAFALARKAGAGDREALRVLDEACQHRSHAARLVARIARAFVGRPDKMAAFVRVVRAGE